MPTTRLVPQAMPLAWFEFEEPPRPVRGRFVRRDLRDGGVRGWYLELDGRPVPFKFFCRTGQGQRPVLILLPGMGLTLVSFYGIAPYLFESHDLLLIDYATLSMPERYPREGVGMRPMIRSTWQVADAVGVEQACLAGNSLGGGMCLAATIEFPGRVEKLLLINPAVYPQELPFGYRLARFPLVGELMMFISPGEKLIDGLEQIGFADRTRFDPAVRASYLRTMGTYAGRRVLMHLMRQLPANSRELALHVPRLGEIRAPTLVVWGQQDRLLAQGADARLERDLPHATFVRFPDLSHMPHEEAPERLGPLLAAFLRAP